MATIVSVLHGSSQQATSNTYAFGAAVPVGHTLMVAVSNVGTGASMNGVSDARGNTYTVVKQTSNSASGNDLAELICNVTHAISSGDLLTVASGAASSFYQIVRADDIDAGLSVSSSSLAANASSSTQTTSFTTATATAIAWAVDQTFSSGTPDATYTDGIFVETTTFPTRSGHSNVMQTGVAQPGAAGSYSAVCDWGGVSSSGAAGVVVLDVTPPSSLDLTGVRGAIASAHSRVGTLTTTDATILNLTGKKTTHTVADGRFGQFTAEYLNNGGVAWADARFGTLSSAAAITAITGIKGAIGLADSRYGTLTTNTRGNLELHGTKSAHLVGESRFGLLSLFGEDLTGLPTVYAIADSRFGSLLLHNRTPGVVTIRAENRGLVSIRLGN